MAQILLPISDQAAGSWASSPLWSKVDDDSTVNPSGDGTTIVSADNSAPDDADLELTSSGVGDPGVTTGHIIRARWNKSASGGHSINAVCELYQGIPGIGTLVATLSVVGISEVEQESTHTLTGAEAGNITDYNDLYLRVSRQGDTGGPPGNRRSLVVDLVELEIPDATASSSGDVAITEAPDSVAASGSVEISGTSAIAEASDVVSAAGGVEISGTAAVAEQSDSVSASGGVEIAGDGAITEASDIVAASGTVGDPAINGSAAIIEQSDSVAASGSVEITGNATITESSDSASASGSVEVSGDASITEQSDTVTATGTVRSGAINGDAAILELSDLVAALGGVEITGAAAIVEASDIVVARSAEAPKLGIIRVKVNFRDRRRAAVRQRISIRL